MITIKDIKDANKQAGNRFFSPDAMRFFNSRVLSRVYDGPGGIYFITSEKPPHGERRYTVRQFDEVNSSVFTRDTFHSLTRYQAITAAKKAAKGETNA